MDALPLFRDRKQHLHLLCLGAHCDDIENGCGGTILSLLEAFPNTRVSWILFTSDEQRRQEATAGATLFAENARHLDLKILDFRDSLLPYSGDAVKHAFEQIKREIYKPDLILTHYRHDLHQDHRLVSELTWNTFRDHLILEYEIPKWDGDLATPNTYFHLTEEVGKKKLKYLRQAYPSQLSKHWFSDDLFWSILRIRGMESNAPAAIAEGFYGRKLILNADSSNS